MKIAFSNAACSELDFDALVRKSKEWGYAGIEIKFLNGKFDLTDASSLKRDPAMLRAKLAESGQTLVALNTSLSFCDSNAKKLEANRAKLREYIVLAAELGAENVIVSGDVLGPGMTKSRAIEQTVAELRELAMTSAEYGVTLVIENIGEFASSRDVWVIHDSIRLPSLRICWSQVYAQMLRERPSLSIPRLGKALGLVHLCDAKFTEDGLIDGYTELGKGQAEVLRMLELLKGIAYNGWLCVEWPRLWQPSLASADTVLPAAAKFLSTELARKPQELTAYKGDKTAPRWAKRPEGLAGRI